MNERQQNFLQQDIDWLELFSFEFESLTPDKDGFYVITDHYMKTLIPRLYMVSGHFRQYLRQENKEC